MERVELTQAVRAAVQAIASGSSATSVADAMFTIPADSIGTFWHASFEGSTNNPLLTTALGASPGAASGQLVLSAEEAIEAAESGRDVILVRPETTPEDVLGMQAAKGILTARGGITSHAAVVARGWGIPAVVGAGEMLISSDGVHFGDTFVARGSELSINGGTGEVFLGHMQTAKTDAPEELEQLLKWADSIRHAAARPVMVRANADNEADATHARHLGAEGVGLCRTEHMFLAEDRLPLVRRFILTNDPREEEESLAALEVAQQSDFEGILTAMDGLPVTVRLLDPPLHEFLPDLERLTTAEARGELDASGKHELAAVRRLHEVNPMIGTRGVRLGVVRPGLYQMQVRALCKAVEAVTAAGRTAHVEVMIPLVVDPTEMHAAHSWVEDAVSSLRLPEGSLSVGTMIETPRAALLAGELATVADFFSFGTNDLTQLTYAFSRDDVGSKLLPAYIRDGLLPIDPFERLDQAGVGRLVSLACTDARKVKPELKIGVCGEHAGDPVSVEFLVHNEVDYVSCSPYRVPIARLAAAQALLRAGKVSAEVLNAITSDAAQKQGAPTERTSADATTTQGSFTPHAESDIEFLLLHSLRIKGFASAEVIAEVVHMDIVVALETLPQLADAGLAKFFEARGLWQPTPEGKAKHAELLPHYSNEILQGLRQHYDDFLALNEEFKELCASWQTRDGAVNDHSDASYDADRISALEDFHQRAAAVHAGFTSALPRFATYPHRLSVSLAKLQAGDPKQFTGVMCSSYHDVWMELHEDLVQLLGVDRHAEGSY